MKKMLSIFAIVVVFTACKSKTNELENKNMVLVDTTGLYKSNALTMDGGGKYVINHDAVATKKNNSQKQSTAGTKAAGSNSTVTNYSKVNSNQSAAIPQDKGWSHAAKGTVVGAGTGAITGAILNKDNRGAGAIIGSVIGAGSGYLIGRKTDQKTGRVARAKARKAANQ
jgi:hypothetical protein